MQNISEFQQLVDKSKNIVFFGGAGVSTASGIPDFRSPNGLYSKQSNHKYPPEIMLSHDFYRDHTKEFFEFYKTDMCALGYEPCITHKKLAELEKSGKLKAIITQNIDGLHQKAGSTNVIELHGTIHKNYCTLCNKEFSAEYVYNSKGVPLCNECKDKDAIVKPFVTLYGEMLTEGVMGRSTKALGFADLLIIAGTSLNVYPAAGLINYFNEDSGNIVLINKGTTAMDSIADLHYDCDMNEVFEQLVIN